ncbi:epidermal growth factor receptor kinase substrate 8-like protein 3 [Chaetodon trifascialis]|uniref:epidermal growth factor receptor kinase substrate 8-like protein 3 n=1 Tax=Chaetodon trifascialis TaxID=109706 RepID=UPI0039966D2C
MFRINSLNDTSSYADSIHSNNDYSAADEVSSQRSSLSRPSATSIYLQRKEYAVSINKMMDKYQYRVEHLFTCDLDGKELRSVADCVKRLKLLEETGRVWGQSMLLEVQGPKLLLTDTETKTELESMALSDILELKALSGSGALNSLLTVTVKSRRKNTTTVFMFQCEDVRADFVKKDLSRAISCRVSSNSGHQGMKNLHSALSDYEDDTFEPELLVPEEDEEDASLWSFRAEDTLFTPGSQTELDRDVDVFNRILNDIEIFMAQITAVVAKDAKKKKKNKKGKVMAGMPPAAEFEACLHKFKCAFNLLGELNGNIQNPSAPAFVHSLFSILSFVVSHCPEHLPPTIMEPLLTPQCIRLLSEEVSVQEEHLWRSLGDAWSIPSTKWPKDDDISTHTLEFADGWQTPEASVASEATESLSRQESPEPARSQTPAKWRIPHPTQKASSGEPKLQRMRAKYDFISRNSREITVRKGEIVELLDISKLWWKVRNSSGEEGFIPHNVLEVDEEQLVQETGGPPVLTKKSKPAEVTAWLEDKGFSKITVRCLGVLSGSALLGMSREELKTMCPEEGGRVFFHLQTVRSALPAAS